MSAAANSVKPRDAITYNSRMSHEDEAELRHFFGELQAVFERSPMGAMLERQMLMSVAQLYHGEYESVYGHTVVHRVECGDVSATKVLTSEAGHKIGERSRITARPTKEVRGENGVETDHKLVVLYSKVSRRLKALEARSKESCRVLEAYWGNLGERWISLPVKAGRLGAIYMLTRSGMRLIERSEEESRRGGNRNDVPPHVRMELIVDACERKPTEEIKHALHRADHEAEKLLDEACAMWNLALADIEQGEAR